MEPDIYTYKPLKGPRKIRLLHLLPSEHDDVNSISLTEISLNDAKDLGYEALSYSWGSPVFSQTVFVDGSVLPVTATVHTALNSLVRKKPRVLWIDGICVNQTDTREKGTQIPLMFDIYRSASKVLVFLGEETEAIRAVFEWMPGFLEQLRAKVLLGQYASQSTSAYFQAKIDENDMRPNVTELFERDWFERLWTVQEAVVAQSLEIVCGSLSMPFDLLMDLIIFMSYALISNKILLSPKAKQGYHHLLEICNLRNADLGWTIEEEIKSNRRDLNSLISRTAERKCLDPRDRIFALLGLSIDAKYRLKPADYHRNVENLYREFAISHFDCVLHAGECRILSYCYLRNDRLANLPSWVPDWTHLPRHALSWIARPELSGQVEPYKLLGSLSFKETYEDIVVVDSSVPASLLLKGKIIETVKSVWPLPYNNFLRVGSYDNTADMDAFNIFGETMALVIDSVGPSSEHGIPLSSLARLLIVDIATFGGEVCRATQADVEMMEDIMNWALAWWRNLEPTVFKKRRREYRNTIESTISQDLPSHGDATEGNEEDASKSLSGVLKRNFRRYQRLVTNMLQNASQDDRSQDIQADPELDSSNEVSLKIIDFMDRVLSNRALCITESGRCGWVPDFSFPGDEIALFIGHPVPMTLRFADGNSYTIAKGEIYEGESYQVVGEAYIHGIMDGETLNGTQDFKQIRLI